MPVAPTGPETTSPYEIVRLMSPPRIQSRSHSPVLRGALLALTAIILIGCSGRERDPDVRRRVEPVPMSGPKFMHHTIGSMTRYTDLEPLRVSGYGLVVNLEGTGSNIIRPDLRAHMQRMAGKAGVTASDHLLNDPNTAVVAVQGLIPPGATRGARFDLLVTALPQSQVTSLAGGTLWTTELSRLGLVQSMDNQPLASAGGPLFVSPIGAVPRGDAVQAVIIGGGQVRQSRRIELVLNQPSYGRSRAIADRINERFPRQSARYRKDPAADRTDVANSKTPSIIAINVPRRYRHRPLDLLRLIRYLYIERGPDFEIRKVEELAQVIESEPRYAADVIRAWVGLGRRATARLKDYYEHPTLHVQLAALEAGARLGDKRAVAPLEKLAARPDRMVRLRVAQLLVHLPRTIQGPRILHRLVEDPDRSVRLAAYESLASMNDASVQRTAFRDRNGRLKFILDMVHSEKPLIVILQSPVPTVAVFDDVLGFSEDRLISIWDNRLMLRRDGPHQMTVFYQRPGEASAIEQEMRPAVGNLVYFMAHHPTAEHPMPGLDMQFAEIAEVLYTLCQRRQIDSEIDLQANQALVALAGHEDQPPDGVRPEIGVVVEPGTEN